MKTSAHCHLYQEVYLDIFSAFASNRISQTTATNFSLSRQSMGLISNPVHVILSLVLHTELTENLGCWNISPLSINLNLSLFNILQLNNLIYMMFFLSFSDMKQLLPRFSNLLVILPPYLAFSIVPTILPTLCYSPVYSSVCFLFIYNFTPFHLTISPLLPSLTLFFSLHYMYSVLTERLLLD